MGVKRAVVVLKAKVDKPSMRKAVIQSERIATQCVLQGFQIMDYIIIPSGGTEEVYKQVKKLKSANKVPFNYLIVYTPKEISKTPQEFKVFCYQMETEFKCYVNWLCDK